jgi:hypothetical protein
MEFTLRSNDLPLDQQIDFVISNFRKLRELPRWKAHVKQGFWFYQITQNSQTGLFHPHLHCIVQTIWYPQKDLQDDWSQVLGDLVIVHVRRVRDRMKASWYAARYASRAASLSGIRSADRPLVIIASAGRHMFGCFGSAAAAAILRREPFNPDDWEPLCSYSALVLWADHSVNARYFLESWILRRPIPHGYNLDPAVVEFDLAPAATAAGLPARTPATGNLFHN